MQPYKDELLPHWGFQDEATAEEAVAAIRETYKAYREQENFVGMDMARKYLQMGFTRAMRYAKYPGGRNTTTTAPSERRSSGPTRRSGPPRWFSGLPGNR